MSARPSDFVTICACLVLPVAALAQPPGRGGPGSELIRQAVQLDLEGRGPQAREILQKAIDSAPTPAAKANAERAMAMSCVFEVNCKKSAEYESNVINYCKTRDAEDPHNAFDQQGDMAEEA